MIVVDQNPSDVPKRVTSARVPLTVGFLALFVLVAVLGVWSVQARIAGAVIASGMIQVENNRQVIQHPDGGVVGALLVRDGDPVAAGETLLRFDDTRMRSELAIITSELSELRARKGRLLAEQSGRAEITFDDALQSAAESDPEIADLLAGQLSLFEARRVSQRECPIFCV